MNHKDLFNTKSSDVHLETTGLAFIEFCAHSLDKILPPFQDIGFSLAGRHRSKEIFLLTGGKTTLLVNCEPHSHASTYHHHHGISVSAIGIHVNNAQSAVQKALACGASLYHEPLGPMEINIPAVRMPTDQLLYFIEDREDVNIFGINYQSTSKHRHSSSTSFGPIGCLYFFLDDTNQEILIRFFTSLFGFQVTKEEARTMLISACGKIHLALEETQEDSILSTLVEHHWHQGLCGIELSVPDVSTDHFSTKVWKETKHTLFHPLSPKALTKGRDHHPVLSYFTKRSIGPVFFFTTHVQKDQKKVKTG